MSAVLETTIAAQHTAQTDDSSALLGVYRPAAPLFVAGAGCTLIAEDGREYLDFASGIAVNALGYADAGVRAVIEGALDTGLIHTSNLFRTAPGAALAQELVAHSFADKVFFCNSGAEATEAAFKFARRRAKDIGGADKYEIVTLYGSFHGRLFGSLAATDRPAYRAPFEPLMPGVHFVMPGDVAALRSVVSKERTAAIIAEPIQAEGGINVLAPEFLQALRDVANEANAVLIFDEVQCGLGRTGSLFAHERTGVTPDIMTLAKPLAGGLPMGAVLVTDEVASYLHAGDHATTFGGGPLVSAVALEVLRRVSDDTLLANVRDRGARIASALTPLIGNGVVTDVRGCGLIWGIELREAAAPRIARALDAGLVIISAGEKVIRLLPPLVIGDADLTRGLALLQSVLT